MTTLTPLTDAPITRRGILARATMALVAASMGSVLTERRANASPDCPQGANCSSCPPPTGCYGYDSCSCHGGGCTSGPSGGCCWAYQVGCAVYFCCDEKCADGKTGICRYLICTGCGC